MAKRRTSLDAILPPVKADSTESAVAKPVADSPKPKPKTGRKQLAIYLENPVYQQLRTIAFEEETKMHPLLLEGLDRVFADRGLKSIADLLRHEGE